MEKKIKLFANCIPVKGANRSIICDLGRNNYDFIPNDLYAILAVHEEKTISEIKAFYNNEFDDIIDEYFQFLLDKEYVFLTHNPEFYPKLSKQFHQPFIISNAIIDIDKPCNIIEILKQLETVNCKFIEIRFFNKFDFKQIIEIVNYIVQSKAIISSVGFIIQNHELITDDFLQDIIKEFPIVSYFIVSNAFENRFVEPINERMGYIYYTKNTVDSESHCGLISTSNFVVNTKSFTESLAYNSCLNNKISIDKNGNVKNCPAMVQSFGNIANVNLQEIIKMEAFAKYWKVSKDQVETCKDCEFRYICTDCRAFVDNSNNYPKPLKCGYDPYTSQWQDWSINTIKDSMNNCF